MADVSRGSTVVAPTGTTYNVQRTTYRPALGSPFYVLRSTFYRFLGQEGQV